eukprot:1645432-Ditylum_brightwellii.AAC.2
MELMMDIIGCNITNQYEQQDMSNVSNMKDTGTKPSEMMRSNEEALSLGYQWTKPMQWVGCL